MSACFCLCRYQPWFLLPVKVAPHSGPSQTHTSVCFPFGFLIAAMSIRRAALAAAWVSRMSGASDPTISQTASRDDMDLCASVSLSRSASFFYIEVRHRRRTKPTPIRLDHHGGAATLETTACLREELLVRCIFSSSCKAHYGVLGCLNFHVGVQFLGLLRWWNFHAGCGSLWTATATTYPVGCRMRYDEALAPCRTAGHC